jgi:hypothetical protein
MGGFGGQRTFKLGRKALGSSHGALDARSGRSVKESGTRRSPCRNETRSGRADEGERGSVLKTQSPDHHRGEMKTNGERGVLNAMPSV